MVDLENPNVKEESELDNLREINTSQEVEKRYLPTDGEKTIARLLGKSEEGLKSEFYLYKVKELMKRVGLTLKTANSQKEIEQRISASKKAGVEEIFITPFYHSVVRLIKPSESKGLKTSIAIDYPLGEQTVKQKVVGVRESCKNKADFIYCSVAVDSIKLSCFGEEKRKILKSRKACKKPFGIIINANVSLDDLQKILKNTENLRIDSILIDGTESMESQTVQVLTTANGLKGRRKIHLLSNVKSAYELCSFVDAGADKVYTPYAFNIGQELMAKAQITI